MKVRRISVSEAQRQLPELVRMIASKGGRVDVVVHGEPLVSIVRTADVVGTHGTREKVRIPDAARVEFLIPPETLINVVRELRSRVGRPRPFPEPTTRRRRGGRLAR